MASSSVFMDTTTSAPPPYKEFFSQKDQTPSQSTPLLPTHTIPTSPAPPSLFSRAIPFISAFLAVCVIYHLTSMDFPLLNDYTYPSTPALDASREFEKPIHTFPEATHPIYPKDGSFDLPTSKSLSITVTGGAVGVVSIIPSTESLHADIHYHSSTPTPNITITRTHDKDAFMIKVDTPERGMWYKQSDVVAVRVQVPKGSFEKLVDGLKVEVGAVGVEIDLQGDVIGGGLQVKAGSGNVKVMDVIVKKDVDLRAGSGNVKIGSIIAQDFHLTTGSGIIYARSILSNMFGMTTGSGGITAQDIKTTFSTPSFLKSGSGSISLENAVIAGGLDVSANSGSVGVKGAAITGDFSVSTASGSNRIEDLTALGVSLKSTSGTISIKDVESSTHVNATATSGSVRLSNVGGFKNVKTSTSSGSQTVERMIFDPTREVKAVFESRSGSVHLGLNSFSGRFRAWSNGSGSVRVKGSYLHFAKQGHKSVYEGTRDIAGGKGMGEVEVSADSGSVRVEFD